MMKDIDELFRHIDPLIHRYLVQASHMRIDDITVRPFVYSYNLLLTCSNPRRDTILLPTRHLLYHLLFFSSYRLFTPPPPSVSRPTFLRSSSTSKPTSTTSHIIVLPEDILCILVRKFIAICSNSFVFSCEMYLLIQPSRP